MFPSCWHEDQVARLERIPCFAVLKNTMPADDDVNLVLQVRLLQVLSDRLINFHRYRAVAVEFEKGFTFVGVQRTERFFDAYLHVKFSF